MAHERKAADRVAVIAVHGVADQQPGATARTLAELLVASSPAGVDWRIDGCDELALRVDPLRPSPAVDAEACAAAGAAGQPATPVGPRPIRKAAAQSLRSDLHRSDWVVDRKQPMSEGATPSAPENPGVELTDFLLFKAVRNEMPSAAYDTQCLRMSRTDAGGSRRVDVYEMYWADLSRLAGGVPRILTELFTLLFRLSQLGRDAVAAATREFEKAGEGGRCWRWLGALQTALDWGFAKGLALLMLQLLMVALVIVPVGLAVGVDDFAPRARRVLAVALPLLALLWFLYRGRRTAAALGLAVLGAAILGGVLAFSPAHWVVGMVWLALLCIAYDALMRVCDERFPMTRFVGWILWSAVMFAVVWTAASLDLSARPGLEAETGLRIFTFGALRALEWILVAVILWWGVAGLGFAAWLAVGLQCSRTQGFEGRASVGTGRLCLFVPMSLFIVLVMAAWAALTTLLDLSVDGMQYAPVVFTEAAAPVVSAASFLDARYDHSTQTFSLIVILLLAFGAHVVIGFFPSIVAEVKPKGQDSLRLGRWLTATFRYLDVTAAAVVILATVSAVVVAMVLNSRWFGPAWLYTLNAQFPELMRWSQEFLRPLVWTTASATLALSALGGVLSRYVPWLRAPLDMALDVDSHFREFPRQGIPRARIFSRFAALLEHVSRQGYERVVIVAHSQGTVISAELLRYLAYRAAPPEGRVPCAPPWWHGIADRVHLLSAGSPLRQLYAARFPTLYRWVLQDHGGRMGPTAGDIGVQRWVNAYATGDYVGRWLWSRRAADPGDFSWPAIDEASRPGDVYAAQHPAPDLAAALKTVAEADVCLGAGAHTHYFDPGQHVMADLVDQLVRVTWSTPGEDDEAKEVGRHAVAV